MSGPVDEGLPWFKWYRGASRHWKMRRLSKLLGNPYAGVFWAARLWELAAEIAPADGNLSHLAPDELEGLLDWEGKPGVLFAALSSPDVQLLDAVQVHQWMDHQPGILEARGLGKRATDRATVRRRFTDDEKLAEGTSEYFQAFWALVPRGKRKAMALVYSVWRRNGLDDPGDDGDKLRADVLRIFGQQLNHGAWSADFSKRGHVLGYMRRRDWLGWDHPVEPIAVRVVSLPPAPPSRDDVAELKRDWEKLASSQGREFPGYDQAMAEVIAAMKRGDN